ncbi:MAG TPA: hypothetical protein VFQ39_13220 [Longimicrobium sp.]|nr:hypothetical protein [Longimicrobium sp.]
MTGLLFSLLRLARHLVRMSNRSASSASSRESRPPAAPEPPASPTPASPASARNDSAPPAAEPMRRAGVPRRGSDDPQILEEIQRARASGKWFKGRDAIHKRLTQAVHAEMAAYGFGPDAVFDAQAKARGVGYIWRRGRQFVDYMPPAHTGVYHGLAYKQEFVNRHIPIVEAVWEDLQPLLRIQQLPWRTTLSPNPPALREEPGYDELFQGHVAVPSVEGIAAYGRRFAARYRDHILPEMERFRDLREVCDVALREFLFNPELQRLLGSDGVSCRRLIIARLAGDARFEELYDYEMVVAERWAAAAAEPPVVPHLANKPKVIREIYQRLKSIPPLENPVLD